MNMQFVKLLQLSLLLVLVPSSLFAKGADDWRDIIPEPGLFLDAIDLSILIFDVRTTLKCCS